MNLETIEQLPEESLVKQTVSRDISRPSYDEFCEDVEERLIDAIIHLEQHKSLFHALSEDQLSGIILTWLKGAGLDAEHDSSRNGHVDLLVKSGRFNWLGEAKIDRGPVYVMDGFRQLCDRYADGNYYSSKGAVIVYTDKQSKIAFLDGWMNHLVSNYEHAVTRCGRCMQTLSEVTTHLHPATGLEYRVRHFPVSLHYKPTDKSARNAKSNAED